MPISNKSSQNRMTTTTIRLDSGGALRQQQAQKTQRTTTISNNNNEYQTITNQPKTTDSYPYKTKTVVSTETPKIFI
jgi:hypothetical protein